MRDWLYYECVRISALQYCQYHRESLPAFQKVVVKVLRQGVKFIQT